ncbi:MAG: ChaN family lipoprotein [Pirellulaceae bacterium]
MHALRTIVLSTLLGLLTFADSFAQEPNRWEPAAIEDSISIRDGKTFERVAWPQMIESLQTADVVFLGETHDDDTTHRLEYEVYNALLEAKNGNVVLAMEMFERDVQPYLNDYLAGKMDELTFLNHSRPWGNYREAYRPMVERAREAGKPVIASNFPRPLRMKLMQAGDKGLEALGEDRKWAPETLLPNTANYWKRTDNAVRGHAMFMPQPSGEAARLLSTQSLWDNSMGEACVIALNEHPGHSVVHVNGGFHTEYWDGTAGQVKQRKPDANIKTISIRTAQDPATATLEGAPVADFVVFVESRAKNLNDGVWNVVVTDENQFKLHVPEWASFDQPVPLLIWLSDDGLTVDDNLTYLKKIYGDRAAIAVLAQNHRQMERDMSMGGRWFWADTFSQDIGRSVGAVERLWQYVLNRYPVDSQRVCLAGEGSGATVCSAVTLLTSKMDVRSVAMKPRQYTKIKDFPLPLLEDWGNVEPPVRRLQIVGDEADQQWWDDELNQYSGVGIESKWISATANPWDYDLETRRLVHDALGFAIDAQSDSMTRKVIVATSNSPKERQWLRLFATAVADEQTHVVVAESGYEGDAEQIDASVDFAAISHGNVPLCPGPFGGTTVLVLDDGQVPEMEKWLALEADDPLTKRSRFHRLRIATSNANSEQNLDNVLKKLHAENRNNVLIVPASIYAGEEFMSKLRGFANESEDQMTLQWSPGLGSELGK